MFRYSSGNDGSDDEGVMGFENMFEHMMLRNVLNGSRSGFNSVSSSNNSNEDDDDDEDPTRFKNMFEEFNALSNGSKSAHRLVYSAKLPSTEVTTRRFEEFTGNVKHFDLLRNSQISFLSTQQPWIEQGPAPTLSTTKPVDLRSVALKINCIHLNKVVFANTVSEPTRVVGTHILVEDNRGDRMHFEVHNYVDENESPDGVFPKNTYLAILDPLMKHSRDDPDRHLMLRCDNPQCIIVYPTREAWLTAQGNNDVSIEYKDEDPVLLREQGNKFFVDNHYRQAEALYTRALLHPNIENGEKVKCLANRAETYLRIKMYDKAQVDATCVLESEPDNKKANIRLAKALLYLGNPKAAKERMERSKSTLSKALYISFMKDCERCIAEKNGVYNIKLMRQPRQEVTEIFHCDYASDKVDFGVETASNDGSMHRKCIAKRDMKQSELVSSSKAFVYCSKNEQSYQTRTEAPGSTRDVNGKFLLLEKLIRLLHKQPNLASKVYKLSAGLQSPEESNDGDNRIDIPLLRAIVDLNAFVDSGRCSDYQNCWSKEIQVYQLYREEIDESLVDWNKFSDHQNITGTGLWLRESLLNHSCVPNCSLEIICDQIFVRTTKPVKTGEELCICYFDELYDNFTSRRAKLRNWIASGIGFECVCKLCVATCNDKKYISIGNQTSKALFQFREIAKNPFQGDNTDEILEQIIPLTRRNKLLARMDRSKPRHLQEYIYFVLQNLNGVYYVRRSLYNKALTCFEAQAEVIHAIFGLSKVSIQCSLLVACMHIILEQNEQAQQLITKAWIDMELENYDEVAPEFLYKFILLDILAYLPFDKLIVVQCLRQVAMIIYHINERRRG